MTEKEALNLAMKLCSKKEYASGEILEKLQQWEVENETAQKIVSTLQKEKFLDDIRYCSAFVNDKLKFSKWGKTKIKFMLSHKGISENTIKEALNDIDNLMYEEILTGELKKKLKSIKTEDKYQKKGKIIQFALSRGFEYDIAAKITDKILKEL